MGFSLQDLVVNKGIDQNTESGLSDFQQKGWWDPATQDARSDAGIRQALFDKASAGMSWQDLLGANFQTGMNRTLDPGILADVTARVKNSGWSDDQAKKAVLEGAAKHYGSYGSGFTEWSTPEGIAGMLGLPDYDVNRANAEQARYLDAHTKYSAGEDDRSLADAFQAVSPFLGFAGAAAGSAAGAAGAAADAASAGAAGGAASGAGGGISAGAAGSTLMPPAQALSPEALTSMGLTQTGAGTWELLGAGGLGAGTMMPAAQALSPETLNSMGLQQTGPGAFAQPAQAPITAPAITAPGGGAAPGGTAPAGTEGGSIVDKIMEQMKSNPLGTAQSVMGAASLLNTGKKKLPNEGELNALGQEASGIARQLIQQYKSGTLSAAQQSQLDQLTQGTKNQINQYFSSIGQADSTAARSSLAQVDQQALAMKQQMLDNALQQGLNAIGVAQGPLNTVAQYQLGQDQALRQAFGSFAGALGNLAGKQPDKKTTTPTAGGGAPAPAATVQSTGNLNENMA